MKKQTWKVGDWCFCDFERKQIKEMEGENIVQVSDGFISSMCSSFNSSCFPNEPKIKEISKQVQYWSDSFFDLNCNSLNHPDLNQELIRRWIEMCQNKDNSKKLEKLIADLNFFGQQVLLKVDKQKKESVSNIQIFR